MAGLTTKGVFKWSILYSHRFIFPNFQLKKSVLMAQINKQNIKNALCYVMTWKHSCDQNCCVKSHLNILYTVYTHFNWNALLMVIKSTSFFLIICCQTTIFFSSNGRDQSWLAERILDVIADWLKRLLLFTCWLEQLIAHLHRHLFLLHLPRLNWYLQSSHYAVMVIVMVISCPGKQLHY